MLLQITNALLLSNKQKLGLKKLVAPLTDAVKVLQLFEESTTAFKEGTIIKEAGAFLIVPQLSFAITSKFVYPPRLKVKLGDDDQIVSPGCLTIPYSKPEIPPYSTYITFTINNFYKTCSCITISFVKQV